MCDILSMTRVGKVQEVGGKDGRFSLGGYPGVLAGGGGIEPGYSTNTKRKERV
jgi:hypothetical protein